MSDLDRVLKMLESPKETERRKAVEVLARSSSSKAYELLKAAYPQEPSAELRALMVNAGQQIKLRQTQAAPTAKKAATPPGAKTRTSTKPALKPDTSPNLDLPAFEPVGTPEKKKKNEPAPVISPKIVQFIMALIVAACGFGISISMTQPWVNFSSVPYQNGTLGSYIAQVQAAIRDMPNTEGIPLRVHQEHVDRIDASFGQFDISDILIGQRSGWEAIFTFDYLETLAEQSLGRVFERVYVDGTDAQSLDGALFAASFIGIVLCILGFNIIWRLIFGFSNFALFGLLGAVLQMLGMRITWIVALIGGFLTLGISVYFYLSMLPRFVPIALMSLGIGDRSYNYAGFVGSGFIITTLAALVVIIVSGFILIEDSRSAEEVA